MGRQQYPDLTGLTVGRWSVVRKEVFRVKRKPSGVEWGYMCVCLCGTERVVAASSLNKGESKSCGCIRDEQHLRYIGKKFGMLTVIERTDGIRNGWRLYKCLCECGTLCALPIARLVREHTKSCGCYKANCRRIAPGEAGFNRLVLEYRNGANKRGLEYELTRNEFRALTKGECYYCGTPPRQISRPPGTVNTSLSVYQYNGIDRVDNQRGYIPGNCVSCCGRCNTAKASLMQEEFLDLVRSIAQRHPA